MTSPSPPPEAPERWAGLFDRAGHLTALTLERALTEPLADEELAAIDEHLQACPGCAAVAARLERDSEAFTLRPPLPEPATPPNPARLRSRRAWVVGGGTILAMAAALLLLARPWDSPTAPGLRLKGGPIDVDVYVDDGQRSRIVTSGEVVFPGERVAFEVKPRRAGHLLIAGVDQARHVYLCYPQDTGGRSAFVGASPEPVPLEAAVEFDSLLGGERIVALYCDAPFSLDDLRGSLREAAATTPLSERLPALLPGCHQDEITLDKRQRGADAVE